MCREARCKNGWSEENQIKYKYLFCVLLADLHVLQFLYYDKPMGITKMTMPVISCLLLLLFPPVFPQMLIKKHRVSELFFIDVSSQ